MQRKKRNAHKVAPLLRSSLNCRWTVGYLLKEGAKLVGLSLMDHVCVAVHLQSNRSKEMRDQYSLEVNVQIVSM